MTPHSNVVCGTNACKKQKININSFDGVDETKGGKWMNEVLRFGFAWLSDFSYVLGSNSLIVTKTLQFIHMCSHMWPGWHDSPNHPARWDDLTTRVCGVIVTQIQQGRITYAQLRAAASPVLRPIVWLASTSGTTSSQSQPSVAAAYAAHCCGPARATGSARGGAGLAFRSLHH